MCEWDVIFSAMCVCVEYKVFGSVCRVWFSADK